MSYNKNHVGANKLLQGFGQRKKKRHLKKAFEDGFLKRGEEAGIPMAYVEALLKQANDHHLLESLYPHHHDSLYSVAANAPHGASKDEDDTNVLMTIAKHLLNATAKPGLAGAGAGAATGYAASKLKNPKGKDHLKNSLIGAGVGGLLGGASGAYHDAHEMGENSKEYDKHFWESKFHDQTHEFDRKHHHDNTIAQDDDDLQKSIGPMRQHIQDIDDLPWYDYFINPDKASRKAAY